VAANQAPPSSAHLYDALIIGGGPSGSACAYWLAKSGWDVAVVERKSFPRAKTCGDGLTPRSVRQLADMGLEETVAARGHRYSGLRAYGFGQMLEMSWPEHPSFPNYGYCITRFDLDELVAEHARAQGATIYSGFDAVDVVEPTEPLGPDRLGGCGGVVVTEKDSGQHRTLRAKVLVLADGANSRIGRLLGAARRRDWPMGMALRGYYRSELHEEPFIESHLDIRDPEGKLVPGYGWIFPLGDGRINVGVGLLSTDRRWKGVNTTRLMETFVGYVPEHWGISAESSCGAPTGGRLPMGLSVGPRVGANLLVIGDAAGSINPFNGEGIAYAYETGRLAAASIATTLKDGDLELLGGYDEQLEGAYGSYYEVARAFVRVISEPKIMAACVGLGMRSEFLMRQVLALMANLISPDPRSPAELGYRAMVAMTELLPEQLVHALMAPEPSEAER
jgi:geranylgeranyl reductase family protein